MLVIVSWVSFWIDSNSTAARVLLGVTSLLTMSRQNSGINASLPPVSYTKAGNYANNTKLYIDLNFRFILKKKAKLLI